MSRSLTLSLPDELYDALEVEARIAGVTLHHWVVTVLSAHVGRGSTSPPANEVTADGLARLLGACGTIAVDDPKGADNTATDDDLQKS